MALKSMSVEKLVALKGQVEAMLSSKILEQRRALESELSKLDRFHGGTGRAKSVGRGGARVSSHLNTAIPTTQMRPGPVEVSDRGGSRQR